MRIRTIPRWPFFAVSAVSALVVIARMVWPKLLFDTTSLILLAMAVVAWVIPFLQIQKFKWGDFELELQALVDDLQKNIAATESGTKAEAPMQTSREQRSRRSDTGSTWQRYFNEYSGILSSSASNTERILAAAILIERMLETVAADFHLNVRSGRNAHLIADSLLQQGLLTNEEFKAFRDFWSIRNRIVHGGAEPTNEITARILDLGWRLVRVFA